MDDLISRKAVMDYLREQQTLIIIEYNKKNSVTYDATRGMNAGVNAFINFIVQAPTAYDVDKVVEQLESMSYIVQNNASHFKTVVDAKQAIEIVRGGGVNE